eukprot:jgi/Bigna1/131106/aug1.13_g5814
MAYELPKVLPRAKDLTREVLCELDDLNVLRKVIDLKKIVHDIRTVAPGKVKRISAFSEFNEEECKLEFTSIESTLAEDGCILIRSQTVGARLPIPRLKKPTSRTKVISGVHVEERFEEEVRLLRKGEIERLKKHLKIEILTRSASVFSFVPKQKPHECKNSKLKKKRKMYGQQDKKLSN